MTSFVKFPHYLDKSYKKLIFKWSGDMTQHKLDLAINNPNPNGPSSCNLSGFHEGPCVQYVFWDFMARWQQNALMYVPVYLVPKLITRRKQLITEPIEFLGGYLQNVLVSGLFLATYIAAAKSMMCTFKRIEMTNNISLLATALTSASTGFSVLWERRSRRIELLLYVSQRVRFET